MKIHDITLPISESLVVWPGDPPVQVELLSSLEQGDHSTVSRLVMSAHTGTHVDAPKHFIAGAGGVDRLPLDVLIGPAWVADAGTAPLLTASVIRALNIPTGSERVLFKTRNSELWVYGERTFFKPYVALSADGAQYLLDAGVRLVGVDYLSVAPFEDTATVHHVLLGAGVVALEGLNLSGIRQGTYQLICLPLKISGGDGAPARVVLIE